MEMPTIRSRPGFACSHLQEVIVVAAHAAHSNAGPVVTLAARNLLLIFQNVNAAGNGNTAAGSKVVEEDLPFSDRVSGTTQGL